MPEDTIKVEVVERGKAALVSWIPIVVSVIAVGLATAQWFELRRQTADAEDAVREAQAAIEGAALAQQSASATRAAVIEREKLSASSSVTTAEGVMDSLESVCKGRRGDSDECWAQLNLTLFAIYQAYRQLETTSAPGIEREWVDQQRALLCPTLIGALDWERHVDEKRRKESKPFAFRYLSSVKQSCDELDRR